MTTHLTRTFTLISTLSLACSCSTSSKGAEPASAAQAQSAPTAAGVASCSDGAGVPVGATSCLLDLGQGTDTYWSDTDGVSPGEAGCHFEYTDANCQTLATGREFGELCLDADRLVESNPGADECHPHGADRGKPDVVSCSVWCANNGNISGRCEDGVPVTTDLGSCSSAHCVCN